MCWQADTNDANATQRVRREMVAYLKDHVAGDGDLFEAELVIGELLGNVTKHSPGPFCTEIRWSLDGRPTVYVHDAGACFQPDESRAERYAESGRGLQIVQTLVEDVDVAKLPPEGCVVKVTLGLRHAHDRDDADPCAYKQQPDEVVCMRPAAMRRLEPA